MKQNRKNSLVPPKKPLSKPLLSWFRQNRRDLPWRIDRNPYKVWISEIMLQQTQVTTVLPYFERWMATFPTLQDLAKASLDNVLKHWEGLGYYRRARLMHQTAQILNKQGFPESFEDWLELPGIGPYTAAAINSIVNHQKVVAVDGNVKRVVARVFALAEVSEKVAKERLEPLIPSSSPGDFNEAMMELGATICTSQNPKCSCCPIQKYCQAYQQHKVEQFPAKKPKTKTPHYQKYALVYIRKNQLWLFQRKQDEMLNGLWGFVLVDKQPSGKTLSKVNHAYSHFRLTVTPVIVSKEPFKTGAIQTKAIKNLALSTLDYKILAVLREEGML